MVDVAPRVTTPTLVAHARGDRVVPVEEGRLLAALIPGARLVLLESANHILLADEPAWRALRVRAACVPRHRAVAGRAAIAALSPRELEVLELVAAGLTNEAIADRLCLSVRTVERHLSNIYAKLRVSGKAGRAAAAARFSEIATCRPPGGRPAVACWRRCRRRATARSVASDQRRRTAEAKEARTMERMLSSTARSW